MKSHVCKIKFSIITGIIISMSSGLEAQTLYGDSPGPRSPTAEESSAATAALAEASTANLYNQAIVDAWNQYNPEDSGYTACVDQVESNSSYWFRPSGDVVAPGLCNYYKVQPLVADAWNKANKGVPGYAFCVNLADGQAKWQKTDGSIEHVPGSCETTSPGGQGALVPTDLYSFGNL